MLTSVFMIPYFRVGEGRLENMLLCSWYPTAGGRGKEDRKIYSCVHGTPLQGGRGKEDQKMCRCVHGTPTALWERERRSDNV